MCDAHAGEHVLVYAASDAVHSDHQRIGRLTGWWVHDEGFHSECLAVDRDADNQGVAVHLRIDGFPAHGRLSPNFIMLDLIGNLTPATAPFLEICSSAASVAEHERVGELLDEWQLILGGVGWFRKRGTGVLHIINQRDGGLRTGQAGRKKKDAGNP